MPKLNPNSDDLTLDQALIKDKCERDHLFFSRVFFRYRQNIKFIVNWHHRLIADVVQDVIEGKRKNVVINVSPGGSKTDLVVVNFIARGLALNPWARFLHLSYSDDLALLNSQTSRDIVTSDEYQTFWPLKISDDTKSKKRWNVIVDGKPAGGVYATSLAGQITGFRAGHMTAGFQGCIIIDDPLKPEDAFSKSKLTAANRKLLTTVKSRKANPDTPIVLIMQRIGDNDPTAFIKNGNLGKDWSHVVIPAIIDDAYVQALEPKYRQLITMNLPRIDQALTTDMPSSIQLGGSTVTVGVNCIGPIAPTTTQFGELGLTEKRFSYWPYKEPIEDLLAMERGEGHDQGGGRISRHVFASQYQQNPVAIGGNIIRGEWFKTHSVLPKLKYRKIFADTAQKTAERNDYSVFQCWGLGEDGKLYLTDLIRGKWEAPELKKRAVAFWSKHAALDIEKFGQLRQLMVEDKSSGTGLIQDIKLSNQIPVKGIERVKDKLTRVLDVVSYIEVGLMSVPEGSDFTSDFISECEAFTADDSHSHDDQIDPMVDAIVDMLSTGNKLKTWEKLI